MAIFDNMISLIKARPNLQCGEMRDTNSRVVFLYISGTLAVSMIASAALAAAGGAPRSTRKRPAPSEAVKAVEAIIDTATEDVVHKLPCRLRLSRQVRAMCAVKQYQV